MVLIRWPVGGEQKRVVCSRSQMLALLVSKFSMRTRIEVLDVEACDWTTYNNIAGAHAGNFW